MVILFLFCRIQDYVRNQNGSSQSPTMNTPVDDPVLSVPETRDFPDLDTGNYWKSTKNWGKSLDGQPVFTRREIDAHFMQSGKQVLCNCYSLFIIELHVIHTFVFA